jgi:RNA polymerase sigma factor (sigma-70 family)
MNDKQILKEIQNNNQTVVAEVYKRHRNRFFLFAFKSYQVDEDTAKDVYQESFYAFLRNIQSGKLTELTSSIETYLFQIGKFQLKNRSRAKKNCVPTDMEIRDDSVSEDDHYENEQRLEIVKDAIRILDEKCSQLLTHVFYGRKKYEELAPLLGYPTIDSIKTQKYKCYKKLETVVKNNLAHAGLI